MRYMVGRQWIGYSAAPEPKANDRMDHVAFTTDNIAALRRYLIAKGVSVPAIEGRSDHSLSFTVVDPERSSHRVCRAWQGGTTRSYGRFRGFATHDSHRISWSITATPKTSSIATFSVSDFTGMARISRAHRTIGWRCRFRTAPTGWNIC